MFYGLLLFFFRKKKTKFNEDPLITKKNFFYAPIDGRIVEIKKDVKLEDEKELFQVIRMTNYWGQNSGVYLPMSAEVYDRRDEPSPSKIPRSGFFNIALDGDKRVKGQFVRFINKFSDYFALQFVQCPLGGAPQVWSLPGDRGRRQANLGYFPLGGSVLIYIPANYEIITVKGEWARSAETILANRKTSSE